MALLDILQYPDPRLRVKAEPVRQVTDSLRQTIDHMYETMYHHQGVGLAATQVGIHQRFFVMDVSESHDQPICLINPEIMHREGEIDESEGCLSVDGTYDKVKRAAKIRVKAQDVSGQPIELEAEGLLAVCIQHETDHLDGILFIDHLSRLKQERIRKKIEKRII
ncbi:MAG: peptide deformylase [Gammaproteobacteria bacterium RIFCSPHIGHO2_12_FULL_43_28]|nr:MAG: peptide deformylase [Gammaproteobacteria bacterium RIFCSPHIGHO2_12_FULL_43_28]